MRVLREALVKKEDEFRNLERTRKEQFELEVASNEADMELGLKVEQVVKEILVEAKEVIDWGMENTRLKEENEEMKQ